MVRFVDRCVVWYVMWRCDVCDVMWFVVRRVLCVVWCGVWCGAVWCGVVCVVV